MPGEILDQEIPEDVFAGVTNDMAIVTPNRDIRFEETGNGQFAVQKS
jgi:hypothetical protein